MDNRPLIIREGLYHDADPADVVMRNQDLLRDASNAAETSNATGVHFDRQELYNVGRKYWMSDETRLPTSGEMVHYPRPTHPLEEENQKLKEENERLKEEIATLRKRHGYREEK